MSAVEDSLETQARIGALRCEGGPHSPTGHLLRQLADEIKRLRAEVASLKETNFSLAAGLCIHTNGDGLVGDEGGTPYCAMKAERDALRLDAERYRWLRGNVAETSERWMRWNLQRWDGRSWHSLERTALDAAIDAALGKGVRL